MTKRKKRHSPKTPCPLCGKPVHTAGKMVSYHPPCPAKYVYDRPRRAKAAKQQCSAKVKKGVRRGKRCTIMCDPGETLCHVHNPERLYRQNVINGVQRARQLEVEGERRERARVITTELQSHAGRGTVPS